MVFSRTLLCSIYGVLPLSRIYLTKREVLPFYKLFLGLQVGQGGGGGGQADEGGEVEVGGNLLQRQKRQGCQTHLQRVISRTCTSQQGKLCSSRYHTLAPADFPNMFQHRVCSLQRMTEWHSFNSSDQQRKRWVLAQFQHAWHILGMLGGSLETGWAPVWKTTFKQILNRYHGKVQA